MTRTMLAVVTAATMTLAACGSSDSGESPQGAPANGSAASKAATPVPAEPNADSPTPGYEDEGASAGTGSDAPQSWVISFGDPWKTSEQGAITAGKTTCKATLKDAMTDAQGDTVDAHAKPGYQWCLTPLTAKNTGTKPIEQLPDFSGNTQTLKGEYANPGSATDDPRGSWSGRVDGVGMDGFQITAINPGASLTVVHVSEIPTGDKITALFGQETPGGYANGDEAMLKIVS